MKTNIFIPKKINVGFQNRSDTYTKKLAYIIYYDEKGKLRKETSWNGWRDERIDNVECDNIPTSGFVLNKKAGGYDTGWNHRQTYVRVYDPRGFEFEITIPNLLFILENTNSIKGKGLEGDFVYGWDGKDLVLIPTDSPDYIQISQFNDVIHTNTYIKSKELKLGATYLTKQNEEYIYMGRFDKWVKDIEYNYSGKGRRYIVTPVNKGKHYFFVSIGLTWDKKSTYISFETLKSLSNKIVNVVSEDCVENYAELFGKLECEFNYSPYDESKDEIISYTFKEFEKEYSKVSGMYLHYFLNDNITKQYITYRDVDNNKVYYCWEYSLNGIYHRREMNIDIGSLEDVFNKYQPTYKNEYLQNGKLYRRLP